MKKINVILIVIFLFLGIGCDKEDAINVGVPKTSFGIFKVLEDKKTVEVEGVIKTRTLNDLKALLKLYPDIELINIISSDGSDDDDANLATAVLVHQNGINTHLEDNGEVYSGAVDFFLSGNIRTKGSNTKFGVHSWGSEDENGKPIEGRDFPVGNPIHDLFIDYYVQIGFSQQESEDFYYFTLNAAPFNDIHIMTEEDIAQYNIVTQ